MSTIAEIMQLEPKSNQYRAAAKLISDGVDFGSCSPRRAGTILKLNNVQGYDVPQQQWVGNVRLDNQGDIIHNSVK